MSYAILLLLLSAPPEATIDTVVVCPQEFRQALVPWLVHRRRQGHGIAIVSNRLSPEALRGQVRRLAKTAPLKFLVLVGDSDPSMARDPALRERSVPTHHAAAVVNRQFGPDTDIATDNWYADLDDDRVPELAVGRLTADTPDELAGMVERILAYEASEDFGRWRSRLQFVAGMGGLGPVADAVLQAAAKSLLVDNIPPDYGTTMTYASWLSPYCPDPREFRRVTIDGFNEGSLLWVYLGHGDHRMVDRVYVPGAEYPILSCADAGHLDCRHGAPIACFLACYTGAFDQPRDCLAEEMLRCPGGPVAVYCGSRTTMPYAMTVMGSELLGQFFSEQAGTVGEVIVAAKRRMMQPAPATGQRALIDAAAKTLNGGSSDLEAERAEHLELFNLLGDPLLRVPYPRKVELQVEPTVAAGSEIVVTGTSPLEGTCTVELIVQRGRLTFQPPRRAPFNPYAFAEYSEVYRRANDTRLAVAEAKVASGRFAARLAVPVHARGACHVRVFVEGSQACAVGSADVRIDGTRVSGGAPAAGLARPAAVAEAPAETSTR